MHSIDFEVFKKIYTNNEASFDSLCRSLGHHSGNILRLNDVGRRIAHLSIAEVVKEIELHFDDLVQFYHFPTITDRICFEFLEEKSSERDSIRKLLHIFIANFEKAKENSTVRTALRHVLKILPSMDLAPLLSHCSENFKEIVSERRLSTIVAPMLNKLEEREIHKKVLETIELFHSSGRVLHLPLFVIAHCSRLSQDCKLELTRVVEENKDALRWSRYGEELIHYIRYGYFTSTQRRLDPNTTFLSR